MAEPVRWSARGRFFRHRLGTGTPRRVWTDRESRRLPHGLAWDSPREAARSRLAAKSF